MSGKALILSNPQSKGEAVLIMPNIFKPINTPSQLLSTIIIYQYPLASVLCMSLYLLL